MKVTLILLFILGFGDVAWSATNDICDILNLPNCHGVTKQLRRNTFQSAPTAATAANLNPANVSFDKGLGFELHAQANNKSLMGLASGTGKMGGALIAGSRDNCFFGNRVPEFNEQIIYRYENNKQFENQKLSLATGTKVFSARNFGLDMGLILKAHPEVKKINPGAGFSGRISQFHFGASTYRDDMFIDLTRIRIDQTGPYYSDILLKKSLQETFQVTTFTVGTRIKSFAFDFGSIRSRLEYYNSEPTDIKIYSASYNYRNFLFNMAFRRETSEEPVYDEELDSVKVEKEKSEMYYGLQYSINKHIILGVNYNYFLLKEASFTFTFFI